MTEPLGRSQVLEYLINLSKNNKFYLISFERENDLKNLDEIKKLVRKHNIEWHYLKYSNKFGIFSTIKQVVQVVKIASKLIKQHSISIIHARSMIPATIGIILKKIYKIKLVFDIRGFAIDEKLDSGRLNSNGFLFKQLKVLDNYLYKNAEHVVTLTYKAKDILKESLNIDNNKITVIPTCANQEVFTLLNSKEKETFKNTMGYKKEDKIIIHTGTVSGWYDFDSEIKLIKELIKQDSTVHFLVLNKNEHNFIDKVIKNYNIPKNKITITSTDFKEMYKYLNIANASLFFIKPSFSKQASAPTKFAENVACNLPSITNSDVGDMELYMNSYDVGYIIELNKLDNSISKIAKNIIQFIDENRDINEYNQLFDKYFDKNIAIKKYNEIYTLLGKKL
jgi:glycosyltransferase involved in cell wall biosynthesis